jgi:hypothetical protein
MPDHLLAKVQRCPFCRMLGISGFQSIGRAWSSFEYTPLTIRFQPDCGRSLP